MLTPQPLIDRIQVELNKRNLSQSEASKRAEFPEVRIVNST